ncbi:MAG: hypothetical protein II401_03410 [Bacteroidales bacterium]|nr:hypothetical protein [Bacteroidales bacterium]
MSNLTEFDYGIAEYIWKILKIQQMKVWSWGVDPDSVKTITCGTEFHVQGFLMTGTVRILYDEGMDLFNLEFQPDENMTEPEKVEGVYFDSLVDTIDSHVEYDANYQENIEKTYTIVEVEV